MLKQMKDNNAIDQLKTSINHKNGKRWTISTNKIESKNTGSFPTERFTFQNTQSYLVRTISAQTYIHGYKESTWTLFTQHKVSLNEILVKLS